MNGTKEIFIIRHGETDYNLQGIIQGKGVNPSLNDKGRKQAQLFFDHYPFGLCAFAVGDHDVINARSDIAEIHFCNRDTLYIVDFLR